MTQDEKAPEQTATSETPTETPEQNIPEGIPQDPSNHEGSEDPTIPNDGSVNSPDSALTLSDAVQPDNAHGYEDYEDAGATFGLDNDVGEDEDLKNPEDSQAFAILSQMIDVEGLFNQNPPDIWRGIEWNPHFQLNFEILLAAYDENGIRSQEGEEDDTARALLDILDNALSSLSEFDTLAKLSKAHNRAWRRAIESSQQFGKAQRELLLVWRDALADKYSLDHYDEAAEQTEEEIRFGFLDRISAVDISSRPESGGEEGELEPEEPEEDFDQAKLDEEFDALAPGATDEIPGRLHDFMGKLRKFQTFTTQEIILLEELLGESLQRITPPDPGVTIIPGEGKLLLALDGAIHELQHYSHWSIAYRLIQARDSYLGSDKFSKSGVESFFMRHSRDLERALASVANHWKSFSGAVRSFAAGEEKSARR